MVSFIDGPAKGQVLELRRAPLFLRVVRNEYAKQKWDALDQLDDVPKPHERLFCYVLAGKPTMIHFCRRGKGASGWRAMANYRFFEPQPTDAIMRPTDRWRDWTNQHGPAAAAIEGEQPAGAS